MRGDSPRIATPEPCDWQFLMARAQTGDQTAYRALLIAITPHVRAIARRALRGTSDVEDAVQDILTTVHLVRHTYEPARPFQPWLAGIARHRLLDRLRARGRRAAREVSLGPEHETLAPDPTIRQDLALDGPAMQRALAKLPVGQRQAIELTKLREMTLREAAEASGMSVSALKVATHRGLARLRRLLTGTDDER